MWPATRHPRPGDYLRNRARGCSGRCVGHRLQDRPGRHRPELLVRGLTGYPVRSGEDCGRGQLPSGASRNPRRCFPSCSGRDAPRHSVNHGAGNSRSGDRRPVPGCGPRCALGASPASICEFPCPGDWPAVDDRAPDLRDHSSPSDQFVVSESSVRPSPFIRGCRFRARITSRSRST